MRGALFFVFFLCAALFSDDSYFVLKGYLNEESLSYAREKLRALPDREEGALIFQVNSSSGELHPCLSFAQEVSDIKVKSGRSVILYIEGKAVGPAAIFPFLADEIIVPPLVAWGDISYGVRDFMTSEQLRSAVVSLIHKNRRAPALYTLAHAMIDPHYQMVYQNGQEGSIERGEERGFDPLILNLKGMRSLGVVDQVIDLETFVKEHSHLSRESLEEMKKLSRDTFREQFNKYVSFGESKTNLVGYLSIKNKEPIDQRTYIYIKFALKDFVKKGVSFVILDLDTPGGEVLSALKIVDLLQKLDVQFRIPVVAFINDWALSVGALLPYSCRFIGVTPLSLMGGSGPSVLEEGKGQGFFSELERVGPSLKMKFSSVADFYDRNPLIAQGMVDEQIILALHNHAVTVLNSERAPFLEHSSSDRILSKRGELLTLNGKELIDLGVADFEIPLKSTISHGFLGGDEKEALVVFRESVLSGIPNVKIVRYDSWKVKFFGILTHPIVAAFLLLGLILGFYIEINTPGIGIPGCVSLGCLGLMIGSSFASHSIHWIEILIVCLGLFLLTLELFVIPGFGIIGVSGIIVTMIGVFTLSLPEIDKLNVLEPATLKWVGPTFFERVGYLSGALLIAMGAIFIMARFFSHRFFRFSKGILKQGEEKKVERVVEALDDVFPESGAIGESVTPLRPSGKVHIGDTLFDALCVTGYVEARVPIEVVRIEGRKVIVKPLKD